MCWRRCSGKGRRQVAGEDDDVETGMADLMNVLQRMMDGGPDDELTDAEKAAVDDVLVMIERKGWREKEDDADNRMAHLLTALRDLMNARRYADLGRRQADGGRSRGSGRTTGKMMTLIPRRRT